MALTGSSIRSPAGRHRIASPSAPTTLSPAVFETSDGGTTWAQATLPSRSSASGVMVGVSCSGAEDCVATGPEAATGGLGYVLLTTDGGLAWTAEAPTPAVIYSGGACATASECWLYGSQGYTVNSDVPVLAETTNGGGAWQTVNDLPGNVTTIEQMTCASASVCFAQVSLTGNQFAVLLTSDAGASWSTEANGYFPTSCPSATECLAESGTSVEVTVNDGNSWTAYPLATIDGYAVDVNALTCGGVCRYRRLLGSGLVHDERRHGRTRHRGHHQHRGHMVG